MYSSSSFFISFNFSIALGVFGPTIVNLLPADNIRFKEFRFSSSRILFATTSVNIDK